LYDPGKLGFVLFLHYIPTEVTFCDHKTLCPRSNGVARRYWSPAAPSPWRSLFSTIHCVESNGVRWIAAGARAPSLRGALLPWQFCSAVFARLSLADSAASRRRSFRFHSVLGHGCGIFGNNFLPARAGEIVRTMMISSRAGLSKTYVLTTALSERMADAIALVIISSLVLLSLPAQAGWLAHAAKPFAAVGMEVFWLLPSSLGLNRLSIN